MELRIYLQMLQRSWYIVVLTALVAMAVALGAAFIIEPTYQATTSFVVNPNLSLIDQEDVVRSLEALDKRSIITTYAEILNSERIFSEATASLQIPASQLSSYTYKTVVAPEANILELTVEGPNPEVTASLANSIGQQAIDYIRGLYTVYEINFLDPATTPSQPVRPSPLRDGVLAFGLGTIAGALLAIVREQLRTPLENLVQRSHVDSFSNAFTRQYVTSKLATELRKSEQTTLSFGLVRLEGLQRYMDVLPPALLQDVLRQVTTIMRNQLRGNDVIGRWDEITFSVLLPDTPPQPAVSTMGRLQLALSKPIRYSPDGETMLLYPRVGITERQAMDTTSDIVGKAGEALKKAGQEETGLALYRPRPNARPR